MSNNRFEKVRDYQIDIMTADDNLEILDSLRRRIAKDSEVDEDEIDRLIREINQIIDGIWDKRTRY